MTGLSTHVLDAVSGRPAQGVRVTLHDGAGQELSSGTTDSDGRIGDLAGTVLAGGEYRLGLTPEHGSPTTESRGFIRK
ncbi:Transthyretin family protein [Mycobacteroides abscessus]|nr:Transthyretin family protein [Mycobacteroides abscessus]